MLRGFIGHMFVMANNIEVNRNVYQKTALILETNTYVTFVVLIVEKQDIAEMLFFRPIQGITM